MRIALFGSNSSITQSLIPLLKEDHELFTLGRSNANFIVDINNILEDFEFVPTNSNISLNPMLLGKQKEEHKIAGVDFFIESNSEMAIVKISSLQKA